MVSMKKIIFYPAIVLLFGVSSANAQLYSDQNYSEQYRPQLHFSPKEKWMNDPNGMVYITVPIICFTSIIRIAQYGGPCIGDMLHQ